MGCGNSTNIKQQENKPINKHKNKVTISRPSEIIERKILTLENKGSLAKYYKIIEKIGKGCFGKVYRVYHHETGQYRALKLINKETMNFQDDDKKFLKEIQVLSQIDHPNIIKLYEYFVAEDSYYVIVELARGCELMEILMHLNHYSENQAAIIMEQLFSCVSYLHSKGIIHRDLKPENIMMESSNIGDLNIKLIDFGSAYCISSLDINIERNEQTDKNQIYDFNNFNFNDLHKKLKLKIGTPFYMAPEVIEGSYDNKCDMWSLGVIMYILLCGEPPFFGEDDYETFQLIKIGKYSTSGKIWDSVSKHAKTLLSKLLQKDPKKRINASEALSDPWILNFAKNYKNDSEEVINSLQIQTNIQKFSSTQKLQQAILSYLIHNFSSNENCKELKKIFKKMDTSGDGRLSYDELKAGVNKYFLGFNLNDEEFPEYAKSLDKDRSGYIEYEEFLSAFINKEYLVTEKNLNSAFLHFDKDRSGKLSLFEIKNIIELVKENDESHKFIKNLLKEIDVNGDGEISLEEFKLLMRKTMQI